MNGRRLFLLIVLVIGIADGAYLTVSHFVPSALKCPTLGALVNCEKVTTSNLSTIFGVPLAVLGLIWFVASLLFLLLGYNRIIKNIWMILGLGGIGYSIAAQIAIGKICVYCVLLDILIALSVVLFGYLKK